MDILYFCPLWGSEHMELLSVFKKVINTGYDGVEIAIPFDKKFEIELRASLDQTGLKLIGHQHLPPKKETVNEYIARMEDFLDYLVSFNPLFINSHTGRDFYNFE